MKCCVILAILFSFSVHAGMDCEVPLLHEAVLDFVNHLRSTSLNNTEVFLVSVSFENTVALETLKDWQKKALDLGMVVTPIKLYRFQDLYVQYTVRGNPKYFLAVLELLPFKKLQSVQRIPTKTLDYETHAKPLRLLLSKQRLRTKSIHVLRNRHIYFVGDLLPFTKMEIVSIPGIAQTALKEIDRLLADWGLSLGTNVVNWPPPDLAQYPLPNLNPEDLQTLLYTPLDKVPLSNRLRNILARYGVQYLGDIATLRMRLVPNLGSGMAGELDTVLENFGLQREMKIDGWPVSELNAFYKDAALGRFAR